ncbi:MAG: biotin-dependent carboxyltransferase family protein [Rhizobiaceae bacterium]|nr:biotin-dependent carboxyltransferase family protein [Rhizobiaceae bacterium]
MPDAKFRVIRAGPLVSFQDLGRNGHMRFGVPKSGPMDIAAFKRTNRLLGNTLGATCIEVSIGGLELECIEGSISACIQGGDFHLTLDQGDIANGKIFTIASGQKLTIRAGKTGSWCYLSFAGSINTDTWLGASATHFISGFGGGALMADQILNVSKARMIDQLLDDKPIDQKAYQGYIRVTLGPQDHYFTPTAIRRLLNEEYKVSTAYDRMGMRLVGPNLELNTALSIPSEPLMKGSVQVAGDGVPTILMSDHQTTGGYPKIATVISSDLDMLAQLRPNQPLRFLAVTPQEAIRIARVKKIEQNS